MADISTGTALVGFLVAFSLFWLAIIFLISRLSGWAQLADAFPSEDKPSGETFSFASARMRFFTNYSNCLSVTVGRSGIGMRPLKPFSFGHKPIFIPWAAVVSQAQSDYLFTKSTKLVVRDGDSNANHTVTLYGKALAKSILKHSSDLFAARPAMRPNASQEGSAIEHTASTNWPKIVIWIVGLLFIGNLIFTLAGAR